jgi:hypothetical protein
MREHGLEAGISGAGSAPDELDPTRPARNARLPSLRLFADPDLVGSK